MQRAIRHDDDLATECVLDRLNHHDVEPLARGTGRDQRVGQPVLNRGLVLVDQGVDLRGRW